jgi:hypothetical protein
MSTDNQTDTPASPDAAELNNRIHDLTGQLMGARSLYGTLLDAERGYYQTLADRLGVPYDTVKHAAALCDALAPRLAIEAAAAVDEVAASSAFYLPDLITADDDGHLPTPGKAILALGQEVIKARAALARTNEALNTARAEADALRASFATSQADLRAAGRAHDSWRDAAGATAKALSLAAAALADVAAIR